MAGILNNKERIIDFIMTEEGKRQASSGQMKIRFAAFTDRHTFYEASSSAGSGDPVAAPTIAADASSRIYFESSNRFQDVIVPELEAGNSLRPFRTSDFSFGGKTVASGTFNVGFSERVNILTGSAIPNDAQRSLDGITSNYTDHQILATEDLFSDTTGFELSAATGSFQISELSIYGRTNTGNVVVDDIPSLFSDRRFGHMPNFMYLPPVNKPTPGAPSGVPMGVYPKLNEPDILTLQDLEESLVGKQRMTVEFSDTSRENNIVAQMFEFDSTGVEKLSIVDFGEFGDNDPFSPGKRVFFIGKIVKDSTGSQTFMNIFTVVFD